MLIFTPLTLVLAITNPVTDCGCFGDAIHLTNWQTFWKNIILLIFVIILFTGRKQPGQVGTPAMEWAGISIVTVLFIVFSLLNLRYLQLFDFLPYKTGNNIPEGMKIPEGKPVDEYLTTFIYEKEGVKKEFTLENYPADDTSWKFIDQKSVLIKKGYLPPIHDFSITTTEGEDLTEKILTDRGYTLLMISAKLEKADKKHLEEGFATGMQCLKEGIGFYVLTASGTDEVREYSNGLTICPADEITLKTIVRSNPGYMLLKEGDIAGKWSWATLPAKEKFTSDMQADQVEKMNKKSPVLIVYSVALSAIVLVLLISSFFKRKNRKSEN
jgi:triosephosphate isomerase